MGSAYASPVSASRSLELLWLHQVCIYTHSPLGIVATARSPRVKAVLIGLLPFLADSFFDAGKLSNNVKLMKEKTMGFMSDYLAKHSMKEEESE